MRVGNATILVRLVDSVIHDHAPADKLFQTKLPCKGDILVKRKFVLQGNIKAVRKLGLGVLLRFLHGVPEVLAVCILLRGMGWQEDFRAYHAAFSGVVCCLAVILAVQLFSGTVSGCGNCRLPRAALDLGCVKMIEGDQASPPFPSGSKALTSGREKIFSTRK